MPISFFAVLRCLGAERVVEKTKSTRGRCAALRIVQPTKFLFIFMSFSSSSLSLLLLSIATAAPSFGARALDSAPPRRVGFGAQCGDRQHPSCCEIK